MACDSRLASRKVSGEDAFESTTVGSTSSQDFEEDYHTDDEFEREVPHVTYNESAHDEWPYPDMPQGATSYTSIVTSQMSMAEYVGYDWMPQQALQSLSHAYSHDVAYGNYCAWGPAAMQNVYLQPETSQEQLRISRDFVRQNVRQCSYGPQGPSPSPLKQQSAALMEELKAGGHRRGAALAKLTGHVAALSFDKEGCRVVQFAFEVAPINMAEKLVTELHSQVLTLIKSPHGNYVVQKVVEYLPPSLAWFVSAALVGIASTVARDRYGCRVLHRIFEHTTTSESASVLASEVIAAAMQLTKHEFGHFVVQAILEHGTAEQKASIAKVLRNHLWTFVWNKSASYVIETALVHCDAADQDSLSLAILRGERESVARLASNQSGVHVLGALLKMKKQPPVGVPLQFVATEIPKTRFGKLLLSKDAELAVIVNGFVSCAHTLKSCWTCIG